MKIPLFKLLTFLLFSACAYTESLEDNFHLETLQKIKASYVNEAGIARVIDKTNFPALDGVTCFALEIWDESMRTVHWHPNASELGYVVSGTLEVMLWRSPGESSVFTVEEGMCWFIPLGALHCLNNIGKDKAEILVGFSSDLPKNVDLPVAFNGVPAPLRNAYTSPHSDLKDWKGETTNLLFNSWTSSSSPSSVTGSVYKIDFAQVTPLLAHLNLGSVAWAVKDNWDILKSISVLRARLKPGVARDLIWYPDVGTLYVVSKGQGQFHIITPDQQPLPMNVNRLDYVFVPTGTLHTFINTSDEDFEVIAFFTKENPLPEVSLSVATAFFPPPLLKSVMTEYGGIHKNGDPLKELKFTKMNPYLVRTIPDPHP